MGLRTLISKTSKVAWVLSMVLLAGNTHGQVSGTALPVLDNNNNEF